MAGETNALLNYSHNLARARVLGVMSSPRKVLDDVKGNQLRLSPMCNRETTADVIGHTYAAVLACICSGLSYSEHSLQADAAISLKFIRAETMCSLVAFYSVREDQSGWWAVRQAPITSIQRCRAPTHFQNRQIVYFTAHIVFSAVSAAICQAQIRKH